MGGWAGGRLAVGRLGGWLNVVVVILSAAKDLVVPEPDSGLSSGLKGSFVAALLRMTCIIDG